MPWSDEIQVTHAALEGSRQERESLRAAVAEITLQNNYTMMHRKLQNEEKMRSVEQTYKEEVSVERRRLDALREEKAAMKSRFRRQVDDLQGRQRKELEDLEETYKAKMTGENERYDDLVRQREERDTREGEALRRTREEHAAEMRTLRARLEADAGGALASWAKSCATSTSFPIT